MTSTLVSSSATETSFIPPGGGTLVIPASALTPSNIIRVTACGEWRTAVVPPTLRIRAKLISGSTVVMLDSTAATVVSTTTIRSWSLDAFMTVINAGSVGVIAARGGLRLSTALTAAAEWDMGGGTQVVDTTVANTIDCTAQWGTADVNNYFLCDVFAVEISGA